MKKTLRIENRSRKPTSTFDVIGFIVKTLNQRKLEENISTSTKQKISDDLIRKPTVIKDKISVNVKKPQKKKLALISNENQSHLTTNSTSTGREH